MTGARIALPLCLAVGVAIAALAVLPLGWEAQSLIAAQDDPVALADHVVSRKLNAKVATREIDAALAANDVDLANSFLELARDQKVPVDPALVARVEAANSAAATAGRHVGNFAKGLITGEPDDLVGLAGTAVGDLFVFGDIRDAVREGSRLASGQEANELILGLACVGLAVTAGTVVTLGVTAPVRLGLTLVKAAAKTGRLTGRMALWMGRSMREVIDLGGLKRAVSGASITRPLVAVRAAREAVKVEKADGLVKLVGDVGRVQAKAGTQAALDGLKLARGPRDMAKVATLAAAKGGKTRAILKVAGRGAIMLTMGTFNLAMWMFWAVFTIFGFVSSLKRMTERSTERYCARRRARIARRERKLARAQALAAIQQAAPITAAEPQVVHAASPSLAPRAAVGNAVLKRRSWLGFAVPRDDAAFGGGLRTRTA